MKGILRRHEARVEELREGLAGVEPPTDAAI